jgi:hypothetical protein
LFPQARLSAIAVAAALVIGACSVGSQDGSPTGSPGSDSGSAGPTIAFGSPADGAEVSIPFDVQLSSNVPLDAPETGEHHAHLYFDTGTDAADYDIVYGDSWQVTRSLSPGAHTITVALANPDHSLAGPTASITVNVTGSAPAPGGGAPPAPTFDYGY